jgi:hypothetical protein
LGGQFFLGDSSITIGICTLQQRLQTLVFHIRDHNLAITICVERLQFL